MPSPLHLAPIYPNKSSPADFPHLWSKVGSYVDRTDWQLINAMLAGQGSVAFIIDQAIHATAEHIRNRKLTPVVDTARFLQYLRERSFTEPLAETQGSTSDVGGRDAQAGERVTHRSDVPASTGQDAPGRRGEAGKHPVRKSGKARRDV